MAGRVGERFRSYSYLPSRRIGDPSWAKPPPPTCLQSAISLPPMPNHDKPHFPPPGFSMSMANKIKGNCQHEGHR